MKRYISLLAGFSAFLILVGAGCAAQNNVVGTEKTEQETSTIDNKTKDSDIEVKENESDENEDEDENESEEIKSAPTTKPAVEVKTTASFTMADVARHSTPENCYIVVRNTVYDVTKFTDKHPGGSDKIIPLCGKDATGPFTQVHGGQPKPENVLTGLEIGALKK